MSPEELAVNVGPIVADQGELSVTKLSQPKTRYAKCVSDNGGLAQRSGEVHVRFLVRSRGIAEGVSVAKRVNVSEAAAVAWPRLSIAVASGRPRHRWWARRS